MSDDVANGLGDDTSAPMVALLNRVPIELLYGLAVVFFAILYSAAGAYDTDEVGILHRLALWTVIPALIIAQTVFIIRIASVLPVVARSIAALALVCILVALEVHALKYTGLVPHSPDPILPFIIFMAPAVIPVSGSVILAELFRPNFRISLPSKSEPQTFSSWPTAPVAWVHANDHYLKIKLVSGETRFVRGRIKDAVKRLADAGLQVHRSWWVSRTEMVRIETNGRDRSIRVKQGQNIPVGRSRVARLKEAGWL